MQLLMKLFIRGQEILLLVKIGIICGLMKDLPFSLKEKYLQSLMVKTLLWKKLTLVKLQCKMQLTASNAIKNQLMHNFILMLIKKIQMSPFQKFLTKKDFPSSGIYNSNLLTILPQLKVQILCKNLLMVGSQVR